MKRRTLTGSLTAMAMVLGALAGSGLEPATARADPTGPPSGVPSHFVDYGDGTGTAWADCLGGHNGRCWSHDLDDLIPRLQQALGTGDRPGPASPPRQGLAPGIRSAPSPTGCVSSNTRQDQLGQTVRSHLHTPRRPDRSRDPEYRPAHTESSPPPEARDSRRSPTAPHAPRPGPRSRSAAPDCRCAAPRRA